MAVTFDTIGAGATNGTNAANSLTLTWSHTCSGNNRAVVVPVIFGGITGTASFGTVTYAGSAMTTLTTAGFNNDLTAGIIGLFGRMNPPAGASTISVTGNATTTVGSGCGNSMSFNGVQTLATAVNATGTGTALSQSITGNSDGMIVQAFGNNDTNAPGSYNRTSRFAFSGATFNGSALSEVAGTANGTGSPLSFTATGFSSTPWAGVGVPLVAAAIPFIAQQFIARRIPMYRASSY